MTNPATNEASKPRPSSPPERTPIQIDRLLLCKHGTMDGIMIPDGTNGLAEKTAHTLNAGVHGDTKLEIEHLPWMRVFRVVRSRKSERSDPKGGKAIEEWAVMGKPFHIPDSWAVSVPAGE